MSEPDPYEVYAIKFGKVERTANSNFMEEDPRGDEPMPLDMYMWLIQNEDRTMVVDTGFKSIIAEEVEGMEHYRNPVDGLNLLGVEAEEVDDVLLTHTHLDHSGNLDGFPKADIHVQEKEMEYATGPCMNHAFIRDNTMFLDDILTLVQLVYEDRVVFHDGDVELYDGLSLHLTGGHTYGQMVVRVWTESGWLVLTSDAVHLYEHIEEDVPFAIEVDIDELLNGYEKIRRLASSPENIVPGHDPKTMDRYEAPSEDLEGIVVRLG